ncbi:hypothetical protein ACOMHN_027178 [Nucella lapillus]
MGRTIVDACTLGRTIADACTLGRTIVDACTLGRTIVDACTLGRTIVDACTLGRTIVDACTLGRTIVDGGSRGTEAAEAANDVAIQDLWNTEAAEAANDVDNQASTDNETADDDNDEANVTSEDRQTDKEPRGDNTFKNHRHGPRTNPFQYRCPGGEVDSVQYFHPGYDQVQTKRLSWLMVNPPMYPNRGCFKVGKVKPDDAIGKGDESTVNGSRGAGHVTPLAEMWLGGPEGGGVYTVALHRLTSHNSRPDRQSGRPLCVLPCRGSHSLSGIRDNPEVAVAIGYGDRPWR